MIVKVVKVWGIWEHKSTNCKIAKRGREILNFCMVILNTVN